MPVCSTFLLNAALQAVGSFARYCAFRESDVATPVLSDPGLVHLEDGEIDAEEGDLRNRLLALGSQFRNVGASAAAAAILSSYGSSDTRQMMLAVAGSAEWRAAGPSTPDGNSVYIREATDGRLYMLATYLSYGDGAYTDPSLNQRLWLLPSDHLSAQAAFAGLPFSLPTEEPTVDRLSAGHSSPSIDAALRDLIVLLCEEGSAHLARRIYDEQLGGSTPLHLPAHLAHLVASEPAAATGADVAKQSLPRTKTSAAA